MVNQALFDKYFNQIEDSFTRKVTQKNRDGWLEEIVNCDPHLFGLTMRKLKRGDKFPTFGIYWTVYNIVKAENPKGDAQERGCDDCRKGYIHYVQGGYDVTAFCKVCWPEKRAAQDPKIPRTYQPGMEPWKSKDFVMIPPATARAMMGELADNIDKRGYDWEKETVEAWAMHYQAISGREKA